MFPLANVFPLLLTFAAMTGVVFHDSQFDHIASSALTMPAITSDLDSVNSSLRVSNPHIHAERGSTNSNQPIIQPRNDGKKYILRNKLIGNPSGSDYLWPSE